MRSTAEAYMPYNGVEFKVPRMRIPEHITNQFNRTNERAVSLLPKKEVIFDRQNHIDMKNFELQATSEPLLQQVPAGVDLQNYTLQQTSEKPWDVRLANGLNIIDIGTIGVGGVLTLFGNPAGLGLMILGGGGLIGTKIYTDWRMRDK